jgi:DNA-binding YbaB/EbfC family protein
MNLAKMMKQAQELQGKMAAMQEELARSEIEGSSGGGMVKAVMTGKHELKRLSIDPSLVTPDDTEVLEDLIVAAVNDARVRVEEHVKQEMAKVTGGLNLPAGLNLPF